MAAPNPVWGRRDPLRSRPEDEEVGGQRTIAEPREREQGRVGRSGDLYSPSLHVSLCFTAFVVGKKKNLQHLPLLFTIVVAYLRGSTSNFYIQSVQ